MSTQTTTGSTWIPDDSSFAARLALIRWQKRWNQKEAALACGFPYSTWRAWEDGAHPHDVVGASTQIAERTGADEYWLLTGRRGNENGPRPTGRSDEGLNEGEDTVRHRRLERRTRWLMSVPPIEHGAVVLDLDAHRRPAA